ETEYLEEKSKHVLTKSELTRFKRLSKQFKDDPIMNRIEKLSHKVLNFLLEQYDEYISQGKEQRDLVEVSVQEIEYWFEHVRDLDKEVQTVHYMWLLPLVSNIAKLHIMEHKLQQGQQKKQVKRPRKRIRID